MLIRRTIKRSTYKTSCNLVALNTKKIPTPPLQRIHCRTFLLKVLQKQKIITVILKIKKPIISPFFGGMEFINHAINDKPMRNPIKKLRRNTRFLEERYL